MLTPVVRLPPKCRTLLSRRLTELWNVDIPATYRSLVTDTPTPAISNFLVPAISTINCASPGNPILVWRSPTCLI